MKHIEYYSNVKFIENARNTTKIALCLSVSTHEYSVYRKPIDTRDMHEYEVYEYPIDTI